MYSNVLEITPAMAQVFLSSNEGNRNIRTAHVQMIAKVMTKGEWQVTHQGIAFSKEGRLLDGQHRLSAIVLSGIAVKMMVTHGLDDEKFLCIDNGAKRSNADVLGMSNHFAADCSLAASLIARGTFSNTHKQTTQELSDVSEVLRPLHEKIIIGQSGSGLVRNSYARLAAYVLILDNPSNENYIMDLFGDLARASIEKLPPVALAFVKFNMLNKEKIARSKISGELFARYLNTFKKENKELTTSVITDKRRIECLEFGQSVLVRAMGL